MDSALQPGDWECRIVRVALGAERATVHELSAWGWTLKSGSAGTVDLPTGIRDAYDTTAGGLDADSRGTPCLNLCFVRQRTAHTPRLDELESSLAHLRRTEPAPPAAPAAPTGLRVSFMMMAAAAVLFAVPLLVDRWWTAAAITQVAAALLALARFLVPSLRFRWEKDEHERACERYSRENAEYEEVVVQRLTWRRDTLAERDRLVSGP